MMQVHETAYLYKIVYIHCTRCSKWRSIPHACSHGIVNLGAQVALHARHGYCPGALLGIAACEITRRISGDTTKVLLCSKTKYVQLSQSLPQRHCEIWPLAYSSIQMCKQKHGHQFKHAFYFMYKPWFCYKTCSLQHFVKVVHTTTSLLFKGIKTEWFESLFLFHVTHVFLSLPDLKTKNYCAPFRYHVTMAAMLKFPYCSARAPQRNGSSQLNDCNSETVNT